MKIVINKSYGGFSLSPAAVKRMAELQGKPCYFFVRTSGNLDNLSPCSEQVAAKSLIWSSYTVPNPEEVAGSNDNFYAMSYEERKASNHRWADITLTSRPENRADPLLIQVVEELAEKADGSGASLSVAEIPDGTKWEIDEYDGLEHVAEKHRTWN